MNAVAEGFIELPAARPIEASDADRRVLVRLSQGFMREAADKIERVLHRAGTGDGQDVTRAGASINRLWTASRAAPLVRR